MSEEVTWRYYLMSSDSNHSIGTCSQCQDLLIERLRTNSVHLGYGFMERITSEKLKKRIAEAAIMGSIKRWVP